MTSNPRGVVNALLDAIVAEDEERAASLADLSAPELASLQMRHSSAAGALRLEPEFTLTDGDRVTTAVWLPLPAGSHVCDVYSFDSFVVSGGRVVEHVTSAVPALDYAHLRARTHPRRPLAPDAAEQGVPARHIDLVAGFNREVFGAGDPEALDRFVTDDYLQHAEWRGESGRAALKRTVASILDDPRVGDRPPPVPLFETVDGALVVAAASMGPSIAFDAYLVRGGLLAEHWSGIDPRVHP